MIDDVLIRRTTLQERIKPVHVVHISPQMYKGLRYFKVGEILAGDPDVLQTWHQLTIETAHRVTCEEARAFVAQVLVDFAQMRQ